MSLRGLLLSSWLLAGCASLPALPVDHATPRVAMHAPPPGQGQVVVDAVGAPDARVEEIVGHGTVETFNVLWPTRRLTLTRDRCDTVPCVIDAPYGPLHLVVKSGGEEQPFHLAIDQNVSYARVRMPETVRPTAGIVGWVLASVALAPIGGGAGLLAVDADRYAIPGGVVLGVGVALAAVGIVLGVTHPFVTRPGTVDAWTLSTPRR